MVEKTLVLIKPDAVERRLAGEILGRFERRGLEIRAAKLLTVDPGLAEEHYAEHRDKPFFGELVDFITSAPTLALVLEGESPSLGRCRRSPAKTWSSSAAARPTSLRGSRNAGPDPSASI